MEEESSSGYTTITFEAEESDFLNNNNVRKRIIHKMLDASCKIQLEDLNFLHYDKSNITAVEKLLNEWPCEVREYWGQIQNLVCLVQFLFKYGTIVIIVIGLVVNIYSIFVLSSPPINKCNISVYLKALAVSDIGALIFNISVGVLRARSTVISNFYTNHKWMCTLHKILLSVFLYYSTWLVVTFTFERLLMIKNPFKVHTWQNEKPAKIAVVVLALVTLSLASLRSLSNGFEQDNLYGYQPCGVDNHVISINMVPFILLTTIIPTFLITAANICLLIHVWRSARDHVNLNATDDQTNTFKATRMLIIISVAYLLLYLPLGVIGCTEVIYRNQEPPRVNGLVNIKWKKTMLLLRWIRGLCFFLHLMNNVNNFFLYCLSGDIFRQTVRVCSSILLQKICPRTKDQNRFPRQAVRNERTNRLNNKQTTITNHSSSHRRSMEIESCNHNATYIKSVEENKTLE